jgi:hypothetical protein
MNELMNSASGYFATAASAVGASPSQLAVALWVTAAMVALGFIAAREYRDLGK